MDGMKFVSAKGRCHGIGYDKLIIHILERLLGESCSSARKVKESRGGIRVRTYRVQVPNDLVESRSEGTVDVEEHAVGVLDFETLPEPRHNGLEFLGRANFESRAGEGGGVADRLKVYDDLFLRELDGGSESGGDITGLGGQDGGGGHG